MQETVTNSNEKETLFSSFLNVLEAQEKKAQAERQLQEEKYLRRTQRIYDYHERQRGDVTELRRCMELVSQHAHALEAALRAAGGSGGGNSGGVALGGALARQAATLQRCMAQCVRDAATIRDHMAAHRRDHMDAVLAKMEGELARWTAFVQRAVDAACSSEMLFDNLHNMIAEQRRCIRDVSASGMLSPAPPLGVGSSPPHTPVPSRAHVSIACSTPIAND